MNNGALFGRDNPELNTIMSYGIDPILLAMVCILPQTPEVLETLKTTRASCYDSTGLYRDSTPKIPISISLQADLERARREDTQRKEKRIWVQMDPSLEPITHAWLKPTNALRSTR